MRTCRTLGQKAVERWFLLCLHHAERRQKHPWARPWCVQKSPNLLPYKLAKHTHTQTNKHHLQAIKVGGPQREHCDWKLRRQHSRSHASVRLKLSAACLPARVSFFVASIGESQPPAPAYSIDSSVEGVQLGSSVFGPARHDSNKHEPPNNLSKAKTKPTHPCGTLQKGNVFCTSRAGTCPRSPVSAMQIRPRRPASAFKGHCFAGFRHICRFQVSAGLWWAL